MASVKLLEPGSYQLRGAFTPETTEGGFLPVAEGEVVTLATCFENGWSHVENKAGASGFVPTEYLAPYVPPPVKAVLPRGVQPKPMIGSAASLDSQPPRPSSPTPRPASPTPSDSARPPKPVLPISSKPPRPVLAGSFGSPNPSPLPPSAQTTPRQRGDSRPVSMFAVPMRSTSGGAPPPLPASLPPTPPPLADPSPRQPLSPTLLNSIAGGIQRRGPQLEKRTSSIENIPLIPIIAAASSSSSSSSSSSAYGEDGELMSPSDDPNAGLSEVIDRTVVRFSRQSELFDKIAEALYDTMEQSKKLTDSFRLLELLTREYSSLDFNRQEKKRQMPSYFRSLSETMLQLSQAHAQFDTAFSQRVVVPVKQVHQKIIPEARSSYSMSLDAAQKRAVAELKLTQIGQKSQLKLEKLAELERDFKSSKALEEKLRKDSAISAWKSYEATNLCAVRSLSTTVELLFSTVVGMQTVLAEQSDRMRREGYPPLFIEAPPAQLERLFAAHAQQAASASSTDLSAVMRGVVQVEAASASADAPSKLVRSLLSDERSFLSELGMINDVFRSAAEDKLGKGDLSDADRQSVFGSVDGVIKMHRRLLEEIQEVVVSWPAVHIGAVFLDKVTDVDSAYVPFLGGYQRAVDTIAKCSKQSKAFAGLLRDEARRNGTRSLEELLRLPLTRLSFYNGWIKEMLAALDGHLVDVQQSDAQGDTEQISEQIELLIEAEDLFGSKVLDVERREMMADNLARVMQISQQVVGCGNLMLPDRRYIADEDIHWTSSSDASRQSDHAFLFSDILLLVKREGAKFRFVQEIPLHRVQLPSIRGAEAFALFDTGPPEVSHDFTAAAGKASVVQAWANPDSGLLSRQIKEVEHATKVFGVSLTTIMRREKGRIVPQFIERTCNYILEKAVREEGIFRLSGMATQIVKLKDQFNLGKKIFFSEDMDPNSVSGLIKLWFRELPEPLLTWSLYHDFASVIEIESPQDKLAQLTQAIAKLPQANLYVLQYLMKVCFIVTQNSEANKMTAQNLGVVFGPNLLKSREGIDAANNYLVVQAMIQNYDVLFAQIESEASAVLAKLEQEEREQTQRRKERQQEREARVASVKTEFPVGSSSHSAGVSTSAVVREGWLQINTKASGTSLSITRSGKGKKVWKTYWVVLRYKSLCYFKNKKDTKPKGRVVLTNAVIGSSQAREHCFCLTVAGSTFFMAAISQEDMDQWIDTVKACNEVL